MQTVFDRLRRPAAPAEEKAKVDPAQKLLDWLQRWSKPTVTPREIRIYGPKYFRSQERVLSTAEALVRYGWLIPNKPRRRDAREWQVVRRPVIHPTVEP